MLKRSICHIAINEINEHHDNKIQTVPPMGEVKTVLDTSPMISLAIHVNMLTETMKLLLELYNRAHRSSQGFFRQTCYNFWLCITHSY